MVRVGRSLTGGYPWVWRWAASASPGYTNLVILCEDVGFWLVLSVALAELPVRIAALSISRSLQKSNNQSTNRLGGQVSRGFLILASAIIVAALLISANMFLATEQKTTTTETVTTTATLTTTVTVTMVSTATVNCPSNTTCASFTYAPTGQVQVLSVQATQQVCENCGGVNGESYVVFTVAIENIGSSAIYIAGGTGELSSSVPANSSVLHQVTSEVCPGTFEIVAVDQGQNYRLYAPGCDFGIMYQLIQAGSVNVSFSFDWTTSANSSNFPDTTTILAASTFP